MNSIKKINERGMILYYFFILFIIINISAGAIMADFLNSIGEEKSRIYKEKARILAESGLEISLEKIYLSQTPGAFNISLEEGNLEIKIQKYSEELFFIESTGAFQKGKARVEGKVILTEEGLLQITEKKIW